MSDIEFSREQKEAIIEKLQKYCNKELDRELGQFEAEFFLEFISKELGGYYYNQGLYDARTLFENKMATIDEEIYAIEKDV